MTLRIKQTSTLVFALYIYTVHNRLFFCLYCACCNVCWISIFFCISESKPSKIQLISLICRSFPFWIEIFLLGLFFINENKENSITNDVWLCFFLFFCYFFFVLFHSADAFFSLDLIWFRFFISQIKSSLWNWICVNFLIRVNA